MKISNLIQTITLVSAVIVSLSGFASCGSDQQNGVLEASVSTPTIVANPTKENDSRFLVKATDLHWTGIMVNKLASRRGGDSTITALATLLEDSHRNAKSSIGSLAIMKSISVPTDPTPASQAAYDTLNNSAMEQFDMNYFAVVMQIQKDAIVLFENASHDQLDPQVQKLAEAMLNVSRTNLSKIVETQSHMSPMSELIR